jgi:competence protein ComEA
VFEEKPWAQFFLWLKKHQQRCGWAGVAIGLVLFLVSLGYIFWLGNQKTTPLQINSSLKSSKSPLITVAITGAVLHPGVYQVATDALLIDLIRLAGGFTHQLDRLKTAQDLNLANKLSDGQQIFIPLIHQSESIDGNNMETSPALANSHQISINYSQLNELDTLEGIGEKRAQDIIAGRPYQSIDELVSKKILSTNQFEKIKNQISL